MLGSLWPVWKKLDSIITDYLDTVKLTDMIPKNMVQFDDTCYSQ